MRYFQSEAVGNEIHGHTGMVTAMHPRAAACAAELLRQGAGAHDAALAALAMLAVVEPFMSGPGGHGAALVAEPGKEPYLIDGSARGPLGKNDGTPPLRGGAAVPTPTALTAWLGLHRAGSGRDLEVLLAPAINEARSGTPVAWYTALMIAAHARLLAADPPAARIFLPGDGLPPRASVSGSDAPDRLVNTDLGATLERIARSGLDELTQGETGRRIVESVGRGGGVLQQADLAGLRVAAPRPALAGRFHGWEVHSGPETGAGASLIEMLHILERLDPDAAPLGSPAYYQALADAQRAAFLDREQQGDPEFTANLLGAFVDPELALLRLDDLRRVGAGPLPRRDLHGTGYPPRSPSESASRRPARHGGTSTTHLNIAAPDGTLIAATFTLGYPFGAGLAAEDTGLLLGNTLHQFNPESGHPNAYAPNKRAVWNGAPTILSRDGRASIAVGAPGGPRIPGAIAQVLVAHLKYGLSPQRAIEVPRIFQMDEVAYIDARVPGAVIDALRDSGRRLEAVAEGPFASSFGRPGIISAGDSGELRGGVDPWRLGTVIGW